MRNQFRSRSPSPQMIFKPKQDSNILYNNAKTQNTILNNSPIINSQILQSQQSQLRKLPLVPGLNRTTTLAETPDDNKYFEPEFVSNNQQQIRQNISQQQQNLTKNANLPSAQNRQLNIRTLPNTNQNQQRQVNTIVSFPPDTMKLVPKNNILNSVVDDSDENENWF